MQEEEDNCNTLERTKSEILEALLASGKSESKASRNTVIKSLEKQIENRRSKIAKNRGELEKKQREINERIAKIDAQAEPYRDRRDQLIRVKEGRPIDLDLQERTALENNKRVEETSYHVRGVSHEIDSYSPDISSVDTSSSYLEQEQKVSLSERILGYNKNIEDKKMNKNLLVDINFLSNNLGLNKGTNVSKAMYRRIIEQYYKVKKVPESEYTTLLDNINK